MPLISANTDSRGEGYFRLEWKLAIDRSHLMADDRAFLLPVVIDDTPEPMARVPDRFRERQWTRLHVGERAAEFADRVSRLLAGGPATSVVPPSPVRSPSLEAPPRADEGFWIAVLPFKYRGTDDALTALAEGLFEEIVTGLSRFSYLRVIARGPARQATGDVSDVRAVGRELGARYVIEGSLRQAGTRLRVAAQLVDAATGAHLWAENYERSFTPDAVFETQDELVPRIVATVTDMHGTLPRSMSAALRTRDPASLSPYEAVLRSFAYSERVTAAELASSRRAVELAVHKAPANADAWAMLAWLCVQDYCQDFGLQSDALASGLSAARRAVDAAPTNHLAHATLAQAYYFHGEFPSFRKAVERAVALNPMDGYSIAFLGELLIYAGDRERGLELAGRAKQLNPNHPGWYWYAEFHDAYRRSDYDSAIDFALRLNLPEHWASHAFLASTYGQLGQREAASSAVRELLRLRPDAASAMRAVIAKW